MRISDWSSDVCSSDLVARRRRADTVAVLQRRCKQPFRVPLRVADHACGRTARSMVDVDAGGCHQPVLCRIDAFLCAVATAVRQSRGALSLRSEEHTSELQSLMRSSYAVFCLKKKRTE